MSFFGNAEKKKKKRNKTKQKQKERISLLHCLEAGDLFLSDQGVNVETQEIRFRSFSLCVIELLFNACKRCHKCYSLIIIPTHLRLPFPEHLARPATPWPPGGTTPCAASSAGSTCSQDPDPEILSSRTVSRVQIRRGTDRTRAVRRTCFYREHFLRVFLRSDGWKPPGHQSPTDKYGALLA